MNAFFKTNCKVLIVLDLHHHQLIILWRESETASATRKLLAEGKEKWHFACQR